ncbi:MAG: hypothetical protein A2W31_18430 [Planctomycetes bacterium RBG_16_64_10]|nr:MAG: hypothetical protein A2W31_18430 [Planctomycetes bacterium RBG_16_64_10]
MVYAVLYFLRVVRYRRSVMVTALLITGLLGGLYFTTATRYYEADASLLILQTGGDVLTPSLSVDGAKQEIIPTYCQLIESAVVLQGAIARLGPQHQVDFRGQPRDQWIEILEDNLTAVAIRRTNIIRVSYQSRSASAAVAVIRAVMQSYFDFIEKTHRGTAGQIMDVLGQEKVRVEAKLDEKKAALLAARRNFGDLGIKPGGQVVHPLVQRAVRLNEALVEAQEKRVELQSALAAIQNAVRSGADLQHHLLSVEEAVGREILLTGLGFNTRDAAVQANMERSLLEYQSEMKSMQQFLGPAHPRLTEVAERVRATEQYLTAYQTRVSERLTQLKDTRLGPMLIQMLSQALANASQREMALRDSFETARAEAVRLNGDLAQLEILEHDVEQLRSFHDVLVNQIANTDLRQEHGDIRATVVKEPMASQQPVSPRLMTVALLVLVIGLLGGGISVYVLDILDDRFRSADELRLRLGVPVLAMVRQLPNAGVPGWAGVQANAAPDAVESEAFRTLRTALAFSPHATERIAVSSSEPGDGKTTVLVNLAVSFAQAGKRTLLIDADLRRPGLTTLLGMKGAAGVSDVLRGDGEVARLAAQCVCRSAVAGLDVLGSGPRRPNPSELLAGPRFADLLAWAESQYEQILVDSPPVLAASDAQILGRLVDGVLLVVQPDSNRRRVVERAVESFAALGVELLGVVANRIRPESNDRYDDGCAYAYGYGAAYRDEADQDGLIGADRDHEPQGADEAIERPRPANEAADQIGPVKRVA